MTIDPSFAVSGSEWQVQPVEGVQPSGDAAGSDFGSMLGDSISALARTQNDAASQAQALATGQADDPAQEIFRTQV